MSYSKESLNFDQLYSQICDSMRKFKTTEDTLTKIKAAATDWDRVQLILTENSNNIIKVFVENISEAFEPKNESKSRQLLKDVSVNRTLDVLNHSLRLCPLTENYPQLFENVENIKSSSILPMFIEFQNSVGTISQNLLSEIFYERSKVLYEKGLFEDCVKDIYRSMKCGHEKLYDMAFRLGESYKNLGFTNEAKLVLQHTLQLLRQSSLNNECKSKETVNIIKSLKEIQQLEKTVGMKADSFRSQEIDVDLEQFKICEGVNKILTGTTNAVELRYNSDRGRHVIANKTIPVGSTVIVESPYSWSTAVKDYPFFCQFCMKYTNSGIPCNSCSSITTCGIECQIKAKKFHGFECKILKLLDSSEKLGRMAVLCFRTIAQTPLSTILQEYQNSCDDNPCVNPSLGIDERKGKLDSSNYSSAFAQATNAESRTSADMLKRTYAAIYLTLCLRFVGYFKPEDKGDNDLSKNEQIVASVLLRHLQSVSCNAYGINYVSIQETSKPLEIEEIGGATFPIISTTNHSCNPNVYRFYVGKICVVKTLLEIPEGSEILDSYGPLFSVSPFDDRQLDLASQYLFRCTCEACANIWPNFTELRNPAYKNTYRCSNCLVGKLSDGNMNSSKDKRKCLSCGKTTDLKQVLKSLKAFEDQYLTAKKYLIQSKKFVASEDIENSILNYISRLQKIYILPCKEVIEAQELLKLFWSLQVGHQYI